MIVSFRSRDLKRFFEKNDPRPINPQHHRKIREILSVLHVATRPEDLNLPGYDFHKLSGEKPPRWSVHVNGNWCITFSFDEGDARDVDYEDYH
jgi:proteic killer suppression protein